MRGRGRSVGPALVEAALGLVLGAALVGLALGASVLIAGWVL